MLALIAQALDFVAGLHIGDKLPTEVLSGEASWEPEEMHLRSPARACNGSSSRG